MPPKPLFSFYGDDFTGSTDALEALETNGLRTVLFLDPPDDRDIAAFAGYRAIGIAGDSRSRPPQWMRDTLPAVFTRLREIGAPVVQYKVCSTFDSSPECGSIGCALEIAAGIFDSQFVPVVPAAPRLGRYVLFGNLFAAQPGEQVYRIDRHPTMRCHPVTPMNESDLRVHLGKQTRHQVALVDILALRQPGSRLEEAHWSGAVLFDGLDRESLREAARLISRSDKAPQRFVVGSSGFTYGLLDFWQSEGVIPHAAPLPAAPAADRLLVLSGSLSPVTGRQICWALRNGFRSVRLDPELLSAADYRTRVLGEATDWLSAGENVILASALGPADHREISDRARLGSEMGILLRELVQRTGVHRVMVAGGDTASHAVRQLGIKALTFEAPLTSGAPLCRAHTDEAGLSGLELVLKGGQVGPDTFFADVLKGSEH